MNNPLDKLTELQKLIFLLIAIITAIIYVIYIPYTFLALIPALVIGAVIGYIMSTLDKSAKA